LVSEHLLHGDTRPGGTEGAKAIIGKLQETLAGLRAGEVGVLLSASPFSRRSRKTVDWWKKNGAYEFLDVEKDGSAGLIEVEREAAAQGVTLSRGAAAMLLEKINGNLRLALEEVRKLATYVGGPGNIIEEAHISDLVPTFGEGDFFETVEAFYSLDLPWTLSAIRRHFFAGYDGRPMITSLQNRNRLLIQLKVLQDARVIGDRFSKPALESAASRYGDVFMGSTAKSNFNVFTQHPFYLSRLANPLPKLSLKRLLAFQETFLDAFVGILDRPQEQEAVMSEIALRCLTDTT
jgi:DNA polymerase-3 subunit delta